MTPSSATGLEAAGVSVRDLEWVWSEFHSTWWADSALGEKSYRAWEISGSGVVIRPGDTAGVIVGKNIDEAKACAQADYAARIMSALSISDGEGAVASEPYKWEGYWPGAGSIDSITRHTSHKPTAEKWEADGAEVTPLFTHPAPVAAQPAEGMVDAIVNGSAPMSRWVGSVDYSTYDGFEHYLETQLRQKLDLKVSLDKKRHETAEDESLATFVDGGVGAFEEALTTYRTVRERVAATPPTAPAVPTGVREALTGKYGEVLGPFLSMMEHELHANSGKGDRPGWMAMSRQDLLLEIYHHLAKLQKATLNDNSDGISEFSADVANMSMMLADVCGVLPVSALPAQPNSSKARPSFDEVRTRAVAAVKDLNDWCHVNEAEWTGWGDGDVPVSAEWWRVKSGQALKALDEVRTPLATNPEPEL